MLIPRFNGRNGGEKRARVTGRTERGGKGGRKKGVRDEKIRGAAGALISV